MMILSHRRDLSQDKKRNRLLFDFTICSLQPFHVTELYIYTWFLSFSMTSLVK